MEIISCLSMNRPRVLICAQGSYSPIQTLMSQSKRFHPTTGQENDWNEEVMRGGSLQPVDLEDGVNGWSSPPTRGHTMLSYVRFEIPSDGRSIVKEKILITIWHPLLINRKHTIYKIYHYVSWISKTRTSQLGCIAGKNKFIRTRLRPYNNQLICHPLLATIHVGGSIREISGLNHIHPILTYTGKTFEVRPKSLSYDASNTSRPPHITRVYDMFACIARVQNAPKCSSINVV